MPLTLAQDMYSAGENITSFVLSVRQPSKLETTSAFIQSDIGKDYEVMTWGEMLPEIKQHIQTDTNNMKVVQWILYLLICFGIFGTLLMMMVERKFEMGMLIAVGMKKIKLAALLIVESVLTILCGCILGIIVSIPVIYYLNKFPIRMGGETAKAYERFGFEAIFPTSTSASNFIYQGIVVLIIGLLLSIYPMYKAFRLNPVKAMKK
jgi:ABC-type lipoprotein release transport system permease subunit